MSSDFSEKSVVSPPYPGATYRDYLAKEHRVVPESLSVDAYRYLGSDDLDVSRYVSQDFFNLEAKKMWPKVWQMACREEDLRNVGDHVVYDIIDWSFFIVRTKKDEIKAFYNACLHRGRKLKTQNGTSQKIVCPYHSFTWNLDGSIASIPCQWDFGHLEGRDMSLPQVRVERWGGFVFINMDPDAKPLLDYLGVLPRHFEHWKLEDCVKVAHVSKKISANWKVVPEAFMESLHVRSTHPQLATYTGDTNASYDLWGDNVNRSINPMSVPSPHLAAIRPPSEQEILDGLMQSAGRFDAAERVILPEGFTARQFVAEMNRKVFAADDGRDYSAATDSEMVDAFIYNVFPNLSPWGGYLPNIVYRFRPNGRDVDSSIMDVMILKRVTDKSVIPVCAENRLRDDQLWAEAPEIGFLGEVLDQDSLNLPHMQAGMRASKSGRITLSNYQEVRIRHFHQTLDTYLSR